MNDAADLKPTPGSTDVSEAETDHGPEIESQLDPHDDTDDQDNDDYDDDPDEGWSGKIDVSGSLTNRQLGEE